MKKILAILLLFVLCFSGCRSNVIDDNSIPSEVVSTITNRIETNTNQDDNKANNSSNNSNNSTRTPPDYDAINCRAISNENWQSIRLRLQKIDTFLQFDIPADWVISRKNDSTLNIKYKNKIIGVISTKPLTEAVDYFEPQNLNEPLNNINIDWQINWNIENNKDVIYRYFRILCEPIDDTNPVHILINYNELDKKAARTISKSAFAVSSYSSNLPTNTSKRILLLGNSFIGTSQIGGFLTDMLSQGHKGYTVDAISYGNASATTFIERENILESIYNGDYSYVFMCGFYNDFDMSSFQVIKNACIVSGTYPVMFPAHNEVMAVINSAKNGYPRDIMLNWKDEVDRLINSGVDYYDFCIDDGPQHSKPLAGYVGAYAIYRNIFNENPPSLSNSAPLSMSYIKSKLGNNYTSIGDQGQNLVKLRNQVEGYQVLYKLS